VQRANSAPAWCAISARAVPLEIPHRRTGQISPCPAVPNAGEPVPGIPALARGFRILLVCPHAFRTKLGSFRKMPSCLFLLPTGLPTTGYCQLPGGFVRRIFPGVVAFDASISTWRPPDWCRIAPAHRDRLELPDGSCDLLVRGRAMASRAANGLPRLPGRWERESRANLRPDGRQRWLRFSFFFEPLISW
jgi:hypothetical protein